MRGEAGPSALDESGSAVVEFVLVAALLIALALGVLQAGLALHVRNALVSAAGEGARFAALADSSLEAGVERTRDLVAASLGPGYEVTVSAQPTVALGVPAVSVTVVAPIPVVGLLGPAGTMEVVGRAPVETVR